MLFFFSYASILETSDYLHVSFPHIPVNFASQIQSWCYTFIDRNKHLGNKNQDNKLIFVKYTAHIIIEIRVKTRQGMGEQRSRLRKKTIKVSPFHLDSRRLSTEELNKLKYCIGLFFTLEIIGSLQRRITCPDWSWCFCYEQNIEPFLLHPGSSPWAF